MEKIIIQLLDSDDRASWILAFKLLNNLEKKVLKGSKRTYAYGWCTRFGRPFKSIYLLERDWHIVHNHQGNLVTHPYHGIKIVH